MKLDSVRIITADVQRLAAFSEQLTGTGAVRGNRALLFRDPDGNPVNLFTPDTGEARAKFGV